MESVKSVITHYPSPKTLWIAAQSLSARARVA